MQFNNHLTKNEFFNKILKLDFFNVYVQSSVQ